MSVVSSRAQVVSRDSRARQRICLIVGGDSPESASVESRYNSRMAAFARAVRDIQAAPTTSRSSTPGATRRSVTPSSLHSYTRTSTPPSRYGNRLSTPLRRSTGGVTPASAPTRHVGMLVVNPRAGGDQFYRRQVNWMKRKDTVIATERIRTQRELAAQEQQWRTASSARRLSSSRRRPVQPAMTGQQAAEIEKIIKNLNRVRQILENNT